jgi:hypothetical protein
MKPAHIERALKKVMSSLPPHFRAGNDWDSIVFPSGYSKPSKAVFETKLQEVLDEEDDTLPKTALLGDLEVGTANLFVDVSTSNVGIATKTPAYTLDVAGDINLSGDFYQGGSPFVSSLWTDGTDSLYYRSNVEVGTANLFVDTVTGNVGVGTNSPGFSLDVHGTANVGALSATTVSGDGSGLTNLNAGNVSTGTLGTARIPNLDASKITTGTLGTARIPNLDASKITTGTLGTARIPNLDASKITTGTLDAARISNGTVADSTGGVKAIYFENTEQSGYYTDKSGILAFDENFYDDTGYGTGTYDPDSTFVSGNGGGLLIKNQEGWGAIFTSQNTRWAKGYWNALDITNTVTATTFSGSLSGNAATATKLATARAINGVNFDGSAAITVNGTNYNVNNSWLRENGDNAHFKQYGNSRQMAFRTDGTTEYASGVGAYPFVWMYGGDASSNRRMFLNTSGQLWCSNYGWLHDKFMARTQVFSDTNANANFTGQKIDFNSSGSQANTTDRSHIALHIDMDSSATGGDTNHEHRMYGIYNDVRHSGDSDLVYGIYNYARSDHTSGTTTNLRAAEFIALASGTGTNTSIYGLNSYALKDGGSTGTTTNMFGVRGEVEVDAGTCTNAYAFQSHIDRDGGTITTGYLYYGSYSGTVGTKWGVYVTGETKNYFSGSVGIGTTSPGYKLDVNGTLHAANSYFDNVYIGGSTSRGLRAVSGSFGTVQTTGAGAGDWEGYSIDGRYVFMSKDNNTCGIYNDLDNKWMIYCYRNSYVKLYFNGGTKLETISDGVKIHGSLTATGNVTAYSDIRHKKDIVKLDNALEKVEKLNGYTYTRKDDSKRYTGLIAQEVLEVLPEAVIADEKGDYSLAYGNMAGLFVEAMKEMKSENDVLKAQLTSVLTRLDALENIHK